MKTEKVVGILGGMGPFATLDFFKLIVQYTPAQKDWEHLRILIDNNVKIPSRTRAVLYNEQSPVPYMIKSINNLAKIGADFVVVPCNSAHYFYKEVLPYIAIPWISIIEVTSKKIISMGKNSPLIIGGFVTTNKRLYNEFIPDAVYLADEGNRFIEKLIEEIKLTSTLSQQSKKAFRKLLEDKKNSMDCIVLACTELPIVYTEEKIYGFSAINSSKEYACEVVRYARE